MHPHFQKIYSLFIQRYGEEKGEEKYRSFLKVNGLNPELAYNPQVQFREEFNWADPYLELTKKDKQARYYKVRAIHAIISMNQRDYTDWDQMMKAGKSMNYRPVNLNHDHNHWLPYPRNRLDYAKAEDFAVEGLLRIDNNEQYIQRCIEHSSDVPEEDWIYHPSIEGRPDLDGDGYHFTGIALLQKGHALPGDPLSEVVPLFTEQMDNAQYLFHDGTKICLDTDEKELSTQTDKGLSMAEQQEEPLERPRNLPDQCVCPECGYVEKDPKQHCYRLTCPNCGYEGMRARTPGSGGGRGAGGPPEEMSDGTAVQYHYLEQLGEALSYQQRRNLPDSAYAYIEPGCDKEDGKTAERCRHMPIHDAAHVRAALAALRGARTGKTPSYASKAKPKVCSAAKKYNIKSTVCGTAETMVEEQVLGHDGIERMRVLEMTDNGDVKELFRPPFPDGHDPQFTKTDTLPTADIPSVGEVDGDTIGIVEYTRRIAELTEQVMTLEKEKLRFKQENQRLTESNAGLQDKLAEKDRVLAKSSADKATMNELLEKVSTHRARSSELEGKYKESLETIKRRDAKIDSLNHEIAELNEDIGRLKARINTYVEELNEALKKEAGSTAEARNYLREKAYAEEEMSTLRTEVASLTRKIANLTEKLDEETKQHLRDSEECMAIRQRLSIEKNSLEEQIKEKDRILEKAKNFQRWAWAELRKAGYARVEKEEDEEKDKPDNSEDEEKKDEDGEDEE